MIRLQLGGFVCPHCSFYGARLTRTLFTLNRKFLGAEIVFLLPRWLSTNGDSPEMFGNSRYTFHFLYQLLSLCTYQCQAGILYQPFWHPMRCQTHIRQRWPSLQRTSPALETARKSTHLVFCLQVIYVWGNRKWNSLVTLTCLLLIPF